MIKKLLCVVLVCSIVATSTQSIDAALHQKDDNYQQAETKSNYTIEELYKLRNSLSADFENFSDAIARIDKQLESLGVEEISQSEVEEKLGLTEYAIQPYYNEYRNVASNVFWEYKNGNPNVPYRYDIYNFWVQALDTTIRLEAPYAFPY